MVLRAVHAMTMQAYERDECTSVHLMYLILLAIQLPRRFRAVITLIVAISEEAFFQLLVMLP